jgi:type IV pilus assembly protein PilC
MLEQITTDVEGGSTVSNAFAKFPETFTPLDITLISSGETSGSLDKALLRLADTLEKEQSLVRKVRGALVYPAFLILAVIVLVTVMVIYVMPQMASLYSSFNAKLPLLTRIMISSSNFLGHYGFIFFAFIVGVSIYVRLAIQKPWGRRIWDKFKLNIWGIGTLLRKLYMARFAQTLSGLVGAGVPLLDGLKIVSKSIGNVIYEEEIMAAAEKVKSGIALSEPLKNNPLFPTVVPEMIAVGEKTGELDAMLANLATYFDEEVAEIVKNMSNLIEPIMIVVLGGLIGIILVAILLPIYSLGGVILGT